ncbi:MAG: 2-oxoacid:acceptor oxidoreductase family protein [Desulfobacteraceae bacterium]|nr:2-oxoacid:acceptor oxidoreductase family protein [Desulfobacteraceae bacterium]
MGEKIEVRLSGSGGQGIVLAAIILAQAAGINDGKYVVQTQSYGVEARGGASRAEVIINDEEIVFPEVTAPDILLAMNDPSLRKYGDTLKEGGILIANSNEIAAISAPKAKVYSIPLTQLGRQAGGEIVGNIVALGALVGLTGVVSEAGLRSAVRHRVPKGTEDRNMAALEVGLKAAREVLEDALNT